MIKQKFTVFFDLDGVLADFDAHLRSRHPLLPADLFSLSDQEFWPLVLSIPNFWEDLPLIAGAKELFHFACEHFEEVAILSAPSRHDNRSCIGKNLWLNQHFSHYFFERNFVRAHHKKRFADPNSILIDDQLKNIEEWRQAGGIGIHFKNASQAIDELKRNLK